MLTPYAEPEGLTKDLAALCDGPIAGRGPAHIGRQMPRAERRETAMAKSPKVA
jgi:hypothetical protein